ncbi:peptidase [Lentzea sp. NBRC 105346]|uniref:alpha/beta fold hydrolase n=1 Tax=Lentzea sp. NBRC 105346 TaxID=3032205 RepID=UPI0024A41AFF|nr:alpha/beta fold hydrolase [Lentzea sp. NBRC 105346]GLZ32179.1 peptidase [Lentzea sp. NBRC 105346]
MRTTSLVVAAVLGLAVVTPAASATARSITWQDCGSAGSRCGTIQVPLDWSSPYGAKITLSVTRHPASGKKKGTLFFLPGAGYSGNDVVAGSAAQYFGMLGAPELVEQFDLVGVEQRGGAGSLYGTPLDLPTKTTPRLNCTEPVHDQAAKSFPATQAEYDQLVAHNKAFAKSCRDNSGPIADKVDSVSQARDLEAVRAALGASQVDVLSWNYGDVSAQLFTELYPSRAKAVVFDGPVSRRLPSPVTAIQEARSIEAAWGKFVAWCAANPLSQDWLNGCALNGRDVDAAYQQVITDANTTPMISARINRSFNGEELAFLTQQRLEQGSPNVLGMITNGWTQLSLSLWESADRKTANGFSYMWERSWGLAYAWNTYRVTACLDTQDRLTSFSQARQEIAALNYVAPKTRGVSEAWDIRTGCAGWPVSPVTLPPRSGQIAGPNVLATTSKTNAYAPREHAQLVAAGYTTAAVAESDTSCGIAFFIPELTRRTVDHLVAQG